MLAHPTDFTDPVNEMELALQDARRDAEPTRTETLAYRAEQIADEMRTAADVHHRAGTFDLREWARRLDELADDLSAGEW